MEYSDYSLDQLMSYSGYKELCDMFLALAQDVETKEKLESVLYDGGYKNYKLSGDIGKDNPFIDIQRRLGLAYLLLRNPETFNQIVDNNIIYFHGTSANALPGILKYGINSVDKSVEQGIEVTTGEEWSRARGKRDFVSFTDVLDIAEGYSSISPKEETELTFPIVFGTTKEDLMNSNIMRIHSDVPEVGVRDSFPTESISCVMVPSSKIEIIKKMVGPKVRVLPIDDIQERFYYAYDSNIYIDKDAYEQLKSSSTKKEENLSGVKESVFSRTLKRIKDKKNAIVDLVKGEQFDERRTIK